MENIKKKNKQLAVKKIAFDLNTIKKDFPQIGGLYSYHGVVEIVRNKLFIVNQTTDSKSLLCLKTEKGSKEKKTKLVKIINSIESLSLLKFSSGRPTHQAHIAISATKVKGRVTLYDENFRKTFFMGHFKKQGKRSKRDSFFYRTDLILEKFEGEFGKDFVNYVILKVDEQKQTAKPLFVKTFDKMNKKVLLQRYFPEDQLSSKKIKNLKDFLLIYSIHKLDKEGFKNTSEIDIGKGFQLEFTFQGSMKKRDLRFYSRHNVMTEESLMCFLDEVQGLRKYLKVRIKREKILKIGCMKSRNKTIVYIYMKNKGIYNNGKLIMENEIENVEVFFFEVKKNKEKKFEFRHLNYKALPPVKGNIFAIICHRDNIFSVVGFQKEIGVRFINYYIFLFFYDLALIVSNKYPLSWHRITGTGSKKKFLGYSVEGDKNLVYEFKADLSNLI